VATPGCAEPFAAVDAVEQHVGDGDGRRQLRVPPDAEQQAPRLVVLAMVVIAAGRAGVLAAVVPDGGKEVTGELELDRLRNAVAIEIVEGLFLPASWRQAWLLRVGDSGKEASTKNHAPKRVVDRIWVPPATKIVQLC